MYNEKRIELAEIEIKTSLEDYATAEDMFKSNHYRAALNRLYYSVFHLMSARLDLDGLGFSKHSAVISKFRELYLNKDFEGDLKNKLSDTITKAENLRIGSDYQKGFVADEDMVSKSLEDVKFFNDKILEYIKKSINKK